MEDLDGAGDDREVKLVSGAWRADLTLMHTHLFPFGEMVTYTRLSRQRRLATDGCYAKANPADFERCAKVWGWLESSNARPTLLGTSDRNDHDVGEGGEELGQELDRQKACVYREHVGALYVTGQVSANALRSWAQDLIKPRQARWKSLKCIVQHAAYGTK